MDTDGTSRRKFLRSTGAVALGAVTLMAADSSAAESDVDGSGTTADLSSDSHYDTDSSTDDDTPEHLTVPGENVERTYDEGVLEKYQPRLIIPSEERKKLLGVYGWVVRSPDYQTDVACYWCRYSHQEGWAGDLDSHYLDHEPMQVEFDSETGDVTRVRASIYHWMKGEAVADETTLYQDTHPHLRVIAPWHQFTVAGQAHNGSFYDIEDLTSNYESWLKNGLSESIFPGATTLPWRMRDRPYWWRDLAAGFSLTAYRVKIYRLLNRGTEGTMVA